MAEYKKVKVEAGPSGWGGPLEVAPDSEKKYIEHKGVFNRWLIFAKTIINAVFRTDCLWTTTPNSLKTSR